MGFARNGHAKIYFCVKVLLVTCLWVNVCFAAQITRPASTGPTPNSARQAAADPGSTGRTIPGGTPAQTALTSVMIESVSTQVQVPVTFGHVFAPGHVPAGMTLKGRSGAGFPVDLQVDAKALYPDGSLRHAVLSAELDALQAHQTQRLGLVATPDVVDTDVQANPVELVQAGFDTTVELDLDGQTYRALASEALLAGDFTLWLNGAEVSEWLMKMPLKTADGTEHPHLTARFNIRAYHGAGKIRASVVLENAWIYEPGPRNFTYDLRIKMGAETVYSEADLQHYHHARWRKVFWWNSLLGGQTQGAFGPLTGDAVDTRGPIADPGVHIRHNAAYMIASQSVPHYDQSLQVSESALAEMAQTWSETSGTMQVGLASPYMPATGAHIDIGPLPRWTVRYLLSMDERAKTAMLGTADQAGTWSVHYRDKNTDLPISIEDHPGISTHSYLRWFAPKPLPACGGELAIDCKSGYTDDTAHQPSFSYIPYLVTGDYYHLEELHFWASGNLLETGAGNRGEEKGWVKWQQLRGQAWSLRTLAHAAFITPDAHPLKSYFMRLVQNNLDYYNETYTNNPAANRLGFISDAYITKNSGRGISPWMDDFFTWSIGHLLELGFEEARPLLHWKAQFQIGRMSAPFCWVYAVPVGLNIRDASDAPFYTNFTELYQANIPDAGIASLACGSQAMLEAHNAAVTALNQVAWQPYYLPIAQAGEMMGYSTSVAGFPSNMQPALAILADFGAAGADAVWQTFDQRSNQPDYSDYPNWAVIRRP